jgi:hypothetical protein
MEKRHQIRGVLLYPNGKALSLRTYNKHLHYMENFGTHRSVPYKRVMTALYNKELELEKNLIIWKHWAIYFIPTIPSGFWFLV